jgi:hypothetical protein
MLMFIVHFLDDFQIHGVNITYLHNYEVKLGQCFGIIIWHARAQYKNNKQIPNHLMGKPW